MGEGVRYDEPLTVRRVAHEIQDELQGAVLLAGVLRAAGPLTAEQTQYFKQLLESLDRTSQLVRRLPQVCDVAG